MKNSFLKFIISFVLLVCSVAVLVFGLFYLQPADSKRHSERLAAGADSAVESDDRLVRHGSTGVTPTGGRGSVVEEGKSSD